MCSRIYYTAYMKKLVIFLVICFSLMLGCKSSETREAGMYHSISPQQAYNMISTLEEYIILDVRSENEHQRKHIPGAISIPFLQIKDRAENELPDKDAMIFVHCRSGGRSTIAAKELVRLGYTNIYDFKKITRWPGQTISG